MKEGADSIVVFTARSPDRIIREGGSQAWVLNAAHAKQCQWLVCTQNRHNPNHERSDATEPHGAAFLVGKIASIVHAPEKGAGARWMVTISEFARVRYPDKWDHRRNPVRYMSLSQLGINPDELEFQSMPQARDVGSLGEANAASSSAMNLTIAAAKKELAATFGVRPEEVEITIRG